MKHQKTLLAVALLASAAVTGTAQASLVDRGNGLLYDNVLNVTWLQDANYAKTSGYDADGRMNWSGATTWAANLSYGGYNDWRLASNTPVSGGTNYNDSIRDNGTTDYGYNITSPHSELAYMYYVNLGLNGYRNTSGVVQANFGIFGNGTYGGQNNVGLANNLQSNGYWSGAEVSPGSGFAWAFGGGSGLQAISEKGIQFYAWAVRPGDVATVPVPSTAWLFGSALLGLLGLKKRKAV